jgi:hypothetical protein
MNIDWSAFWSALAGTAVPAFLASLGVLYLTHRTNRALEQYKSALAVRLSILENELGTKAGMFSVWHQKRIDALAVIYEAFRLYLDFLRRALYIPGQGKSIDPMWDFRTTVEQNLVYLNDSLQDDVQQLSGELLVFWNWAQQQNRPGGIDDADLVQKRLDFEIPGYLEKLRKIINSYADPGFRIEGPKAQPSAAPDPKTATRFLGQ